MKKSELRAIIAEEIQYVLKEAVPSNIQSFANKKGALAKRLVRRVDTWANKIGKRITGGTAIGKNYNALILDLTYQGGEITIDLDRETIEVQGEPVANFKQFEMAVMNLTNEGILKEAKDIVFSVDHPRVDSLLNTKFADELDYKDIKGDSYYQLASKQFDRFMDAVISRGMNPDAVVVVK